VTPQLSDEHQLVQVPDDAGAIARPAHDDVVRGRRRQTRHRLRVSKQRLPQRQPTPVSALAKFPHVHHLTTRSATNYKLQSRRRCNNMFRMNLSGYVGNVTIFSVDYCMLFSSRVTVRIRVSVWLVSCHHHHHIHHHQCRFIGRPLL